MPIYEYRCTSCHRTFEVIQKQSEAPLECCSECSGPLEKLISRTSFHLKGGGWFTNDYGAAKASPPEKSSEKSPEKTDAKESKSSEGGDAASKSSGGGSS